MIADILIGWCTIHGLIWFSLVVLAFWIVYAVVMTRAVRGPLPRVVQPVWTRIARKSPPPTSGRHARHGGTR